MEPKILVASPTFIGMKYCENKLFERVKNLSYPDYDILIVDNSKDSRYFEELKKISGITFIHDDTTEEISILRLISSRNKILQYAIDNSYTHVLMLDSDVIPPVNIIEELLKHDKSIISGIYYNYFNISGRVRLMPVARTLFTAEEFEEIKRKYPQIARNKTREELLRYLTEEEIKSNEIYEVSVCSAGCMLIAREVFEKVKYGKSSGGADDDIYFLNKARELGFKPYVNTKVKCEHLMGDKYKRDEKGRLVHSSFSDIV